MNKIKTKFKDLYLFQSTNFKDNRGFFRELVLEEQVKSKLIFYVVSKSKKNVLRGLHFQLKKSQGKYLSVLKGEIFDIALDCRPKSKTFGKYFKVFLSDKNCKSIFIPPGFAHGFYTLGKENYIVYSCTSYRSTKHEISLNWKDEDLNIAWPCKKPIISKKDNEGITLKKLLHLLK